ncbi:RNA polymerase sigma factor [Plantactinospora sp. GCM10030261]|uniref:RNA polymerase sigma factor n=1 Tax=Plantactinospora sp. GCM10030261 TaxID=3273420 RepID=UPI00360DB421
MVSAEIEGRTERAVGDNTLIERSRTDPEEFAGVFDRHSAAVHQYLSRRVGRSVAEDLTAETFLVAFRQRERYDVSQANARPWLYGIATNLLHRQRRTEIRQYRALVRTGIDPVDDAGEDEVVARVAARSDTRRMAAVLARLSTGERDVLLLVAWGELGYAEVARALDIPIGTVRSRLHSARKRLRAAMPDLDPIARSETE